MELNNNIPRQLTIIDALRTKDLTFEQISRLLGSDNKITKRTFQRDIKSIADTWGMQIKFNRAINCYQLTNKANNQQEQLLQSYQVIHLLNQTSKLNNKIQTSNQYQNNSYTYSDILDALEKDNFVQISYQSFTQETPSSDTIKPYCVKEFKNRWYAVAYSHKHDTIRVFAFDRIKNTSKPLITPKPAPEFDIKEYFRYSYGVVSSNTLPEKVVLQFSGGQQHYVKTLPLHHSQKQLKETAEYLEIELTLWITEDFMMELMSHGPKVKVIAPTSLATEIKNRAQRILSVYN